MKQLPEMCNITTGKLDANAAVENGIYPYFTCGEEPARINEYAFDCDAILIAGNNAQGNFHVSRYNGKFNAYQRTYVLTAKENSNLDFVYYSLKLSLEQLRTRSQGSQTKFLTMPILNAISINDTLNQKKIADVLSCIDHKIALNNKTNTELENLAKTIYDYWFTQFDFPDKNSHPYKSSGGQMVYNETLKREIPAGWEVKSLSQICELQRGVTYGKDDEMSENDDHVVQILRGNNISNNHIVYDSNTVYVSSDLVAEEQKIKKFDIVITMSSGSKEHVGKSAMFLFDSPHSYGAFCNKLTPLNESQFFVENFMHSDFFKIYINHVCIGTGINNLKGEHFSKVYFAYPADSVLKQFNEIMKPIYEKRSYMEQANEELTKLRDYLLPLLMNGQIEVK